ncbi:MAG TPA: right-handed parallel beta-helix repeat-containing protein [Kofleriaceae bacterium]|nr:right-handed parallel beta-helix repeat-containing protein [Kofleriaceae bacterium]
MRTTFFVVAAALGVSSTAAAETWHVAVTGDDAAAGTQAAPWRTIQRAADAVNPGDTVVIHAGEYAGFRARPRGTEAAPIAFVGDGEVTIRGDAPGDRDGVHLDGVAWTRVEGLTVIGATRAGISANECERVTIRNNRVDQNGRWGIFTAFCDDLLIEGNEASRSGREHGIYASNSGDRPVIRSNRIWGNGACGIHLNGDINFGGDGVISDAVIERNVILDNGRNGGSGINGDGVVGALIRNNVVDGNHASGISLYQIDGGRPSTGNRVINNTVRMAGDARWAVNIQDGSGGNILRNNIFLHPNAGRGAIFLCATCGAGLVSDHNVVVGRFSLDGTGVDLAGWRTRTGQDAASVVATDADLFVDPAAGDLALRAGAPAIDRGVADDAPASDVIGTVRPQGAAIDVGAYEHCDGTCAGTTEPGGDPGTPEPAPDPTPDPTPDPEPAPAADSGGCSAGGAASGLGLALALALAAVAALSASRRRGGRATRGSSAPARARSRGPGRPPAR